ncbi:MAG: shikimate kinase [Pseudomonadota bacterium]
MHDNATLVLVGPMGSGKSAIGRLLAGRLGRVFVDVDVLIEEQAGLAISEIFAAEGEAGFRLREAGALADALVRPGTVIATGGGAVLAAANRAAIRSAGTVVYLQVDADAQLRRLAGDTQRPLLDVADRAQRLADLQAQREPLYRDVAHVVFDTSVHTPASAANALAAMLAPAMERTA